MPRFLRSLDPEKARLFLNAFAKYSELVEVQDGRELLVDSTRRNDRRPATVTFAVPDDVAQSLRGKEAAGDAVFLVVIPREVRERLESPIILPGQLAPARKGAGSRR